MRLGGAAAGTAVATAAISIGCYQRLQANTYFGVVITLENFVVWRVCAITTTTTAFLSLRPTTVVKRTTAAALLLYP
jgi:hypothetical protein